jgi:transposase
MAEAHPIELRQRLVEAHERGEGGYVRLARRFCVGEASAKRWVRQWRREGHVQPRKKGGGTHSDVSPDELVAILDQHPDANAGEITAAYNRGRRGRRRRHVSSIKRALYRAGYVVKKNAYERSNSFDPMSSPSEKHSGD